MEFPHLDDTRFPNFDNVNVYSYRNEFDYTRWVPNTKVTLTNVLWNSDYTDVVKFASDAQRDSWFDNREDEYEITLKTNHTLPPEGGIKLPIPFDIASRYNYLFVDIPVMTSSQFPIEYENEQLGIRRWYFFIDTVSSRAPSTTMFNLSLDVWTQFHNDVEIKYMFLERGHAPVAATDTDTYLADPIANNEYLLTPDVTPTGTSIVRKSTYIPFGSGEKWVCIAMSMPVSSLEGIGQVTENSDYTYGNITYSDTSARNGYQLQVNGFGMGNGNDYSSLRTVTQPNFCASAHHRIQNNVLVYALPAASVHDPVGNVDKFFISVTKNCPNLFNAIQGVFVVDREMIDLGEQVVVAGHTLYMVSGTDQTISIEPLSKADFHYPARYQRFAKLYTFPYAELLLTDNEGEQITVRIEDTTTMHAHKIAELAFPFLRMRTFFDGIGGKGSQTYTWKLLNGTDSNARIYNGDWFEHCFDHEIPVYSVYMDGETAWYLDNFNSVVRGGRRNALVEYHNTARNANTMRENALDMDATNRTNARNANSTAHTNDLATNATNETNARNSAGTAYTNQTNLDATTADNQTAANNTMYTNADADATTLTTNTANTTATNRANADATIANNYAKTGNANGTSLLVTTDNNDKLDKTRAAADLMTTYAAAVENETTAATAFNSGVGAMLGGAGGAAIGGAMYAGLSAVGASAAAGAATGGAAGTVAPGIGNLAGVAGGAAIGAIVGLANSAASWGASQANSQSVIQANAQTADLTVLANGRETQAAKDNNYDVTTLLNTERTYNTTHDNDLLDANTDRSNTNLTNNNTNTATTMRNNANRSRNTGNANATAYKNTMDTNALNTRTTAYTNADNTHDTADANADRTLATGNAIADLIRDTSDANATYVRNTTIQNAKETLENSRNAAQYALYDARARGPRQIGSYAGDPTADYMRTRGVQIKVRTMPDSDVTQVGDWFARYGYALNQIWDVNSSGLCPMNHFCYWKCRDVWVDDMKSSNNAAVTLMESILTRGVTIWKNPDEVGKVSVYDN